MTPPIRHMFRCLAALAPVLALACERPDGSGAAPAGRRVVASPAPANATDPRWDAVRRAFSLHGRYEDGYFRVEFPRADLAVKIGADALEPDFEFVSHFGFAPAAGGGLMAMGEVVMRQDEVAAVLAEARAQGVTVSAVHNHLLGEEPRIVYMHLVADGPADSVARRLRAVLSRTATPPPDETPEPPAADWKAVDAVLGAPEEAEGKVAEYVFPRKDAHAVHGVAVKSTGMLETATEVVFQDLGGGRAANTGEMYVTPDEVQPVLSALESHGLHVTAVHNHTLDESPRMYFVYWYATGDAATLARGVAAALSQTDSETKSHAER